MRLPYNDDETMPVAEQRCPTCDGENWVCESHQNKPWRQKSDVQDGCYCDAGVPCPDCNISLGRDDPPRMPPGFTDMKDVN